MIRADTFADDSFAWEDREDIVVTAQMPNKLELPWLWDLKVKVGRVGKEVKYRHFRRLVRDGPTTDLCRAVLRTISRALILISDTGVYRRDLAEYGVGPDTYPPELRGIRPPWFRRYLQRRILIDSPLAWAAQNLCGITLDDIAEFIQDSGDCYVFGPRSASALVDYIDPEFRAEVVEALQDRRYLLGRDIDVAVARRALRKTHVFDVGAEGVTAAINGLRHALGRSVRDRLDVVGLDDGADVPDVIEADDKDTPELEVADIAAGHGRYLCGAGGAEGVEKVKDFFGGVVINGDLLQRHH